MSVATRTLEDLIQELSPRLRVEVRTFVEFLLSKRPRSTKRKLRQDWAGALKTEAYTALELQYLASEWRSESCIS